MSIFSYNPEKRKEIGEYHYLTTVNGQLDAEFLRGYLASNGITPFIFKEAISGAYALNITAISEIDFYVPAEDMQFSLELLKEIENEEKD